MAQGGAAVGAALAPKPYGLWGLGDKDLAQLPGYGNPADDKAKARKLLAEAGFGPSSPLVLGAALAVVVLGAAAWRIRRRAPALGMSLLHYSLILAPMAGFVRFGHHLVAERYSFLPAPAATDRAKDDFVEPRIGMLVCGFAGATNASRAGLASRSSDG